MTSTMEKVALLLSKAERAATPEEADAYFAKAQQIATKHAIDIEKARTLKGGTTSKLTSKVFVMGKPRTFGLYTHVDLFNRVAHANDVKVAVTQDSTRVFAYGYDSDIEVVEQLYTSLLLQMTGEAEKYLRSGEYRNEVVWRDGYWENYGGSRGQEWVEAGYKPVHGTTARLSFQKAFAIRVGTRLAQARLAAVRQSETDSPGTGAELVLASKADTVANFYSKFIAGHGTKYHGGSGATHSSSAAAAGDAAGRRASLGGSQVSSGSKGALR